MNDQHTPGPWGVFEGNNPGIEADSESIIVFGREGEECGIKGGTPEEKSANARLISAAPDMLEALKAERDWNTDEERVKAADMRISAIAKATGQEEFK